MTGLHVLDLSEFLGVMRIEFAEVEGHRIQADAMLVDDLDFDSLQLVRLAAVVESLAPIRLPSELDPARITMGDVFYYYDLQASRALPPRSDE